MRGFYGEVWRKRLAGAPLEPMESVIADVIGQHPEYQGLFDKPQAGEKEFSPESGESNPFLHMGLHIAIHEQVATDRPGGIRALYAGLLPRYSGAHELEHTIMECLAELLWTAQRSGGIADEAAYLECVKGLRKVR